MKKTLVIRHYIVGLMYRAGNSSVQIMSARELARHFDIACSTVSLALKELTEEGYIFSRPGVGTFTNPLRMPVRLDRAMPPLVGVMAGDGRFFYFGATFWHTYRALGDAIFKAGWNLRNLELSGPPDAEAAAEVLENRVDALLWLGAYEQQEFVEALAVRGLPIITDSPFLTGVNSVAPDRTEPLLALLDHATRTGRHEVLLFQPPEISRNEEPLLAELARQRGIPLRITSIDPTGFPQDERLRRYFRNRPGVLAVASPSRCTPDYLAGYAEDIELYQHDTGIRKGKPVRFLRGERFAAAMVSRLRELMEGDRSIRHETAALEAVDENEFA